MKTILRYLWRSKVDLGVLLAEIVYIVVLFSDQEPVFAFSIIFLAIIQLAHILRHGITSDETKRIAGELNNSKNENSN